MVKLDHLGLPVSDWRRSRDWYVQHLGFRLEFEAPQGGPEGAGVAALQDDDGLTVFLEQTRGPIAPPRGYSYALQIDDVDAAYQRLSEAGLVFAVPPSKQFWGYGAVLADPDGHRLHLWDQTSMAEKG